MSVTFLCWIESVLSAMMDSPPKASHKHLRAKCLFFHLAWHPSSCSRYYKVSFVSSWSMVLWDSSTLAHKGILGVRGLLSLDTASRHKLSSTGRAGTISLGDLWSRNNEKHNKKNQIKAEYPSKRNSRQLSDWEEEDSWVGVICPKPKSHWPEGRVGTGVSAGGMCRLSSLHLCWVSLPLSPHTLTL